MARALAETGRHELAAYSGPAVGAEYLRRWDLAPSRAAEPEEVLADPTIAAVIVAVSPANRPALLRRALQSERHVLCVHPPDSRPDTAYSAAMIQAETRRVLFPLLPDTLHPAIHRLRGFLTGSVAEPQRERSGTSSSQEHGITAQAPRLGRTSAVAPVVRQASLSALRLLELERWSPEPIVVDGGTPGHKASVPGWDLLRFLGGEIAEVMAACPAEELAADEPLLLSGRFEHGAMFQMTLLPNQAQERWRLAVVTPSTRAELTFLDGWPDAAQLSLTDETGTARSESFEAWNPWPALVDAFESALESAATIRAAPTSSWVEDAKNSPHAISAARLSHPVTPSPRQPVMQPSWQDAIRCLELDDAARRSVERRRASALEYQDATEEASFKGTMTLVGCGLVWVSLVLLILSAWAPWAGWFIIPVLAVFLVLQLLRWVVPKAGTEAASPPATRAAYAEEPEQAPPQGGKWARALVTMLRKIIGG